MANFLFVYDADPARRHVAIARAQERVAFLPRLQTGLLQNARFAAVWAAAPGAPISHHQTNSPDACDGLVLGEPHRPGGFPLEASEVCGHRDAAWDEASELNGYYAALFVHPQFGVRVEADVLGTFPVYYWHRGDILLVGTSAELFRCHPAFQSEIDLHGVAAVLLTSGIVGGRTLWRGVRRLAADSRLMWAVGEESRERSPATRPLAPPLDSLDEAVEQTASLHDGFLRAALARARRPGLLLSGGLDSRLLAGFMTETPHPPAECLTFGRDQDLDAQCATAVARALGLRQTLLDVSPADYADYARSSVVWEQLSGGLYALPMGWNLSVRSPPATMDRMVCGLTLDAVIGGPKHVAHAGQGLSFEQLRVGRLGYESEVLGRLVGEPDLVRACEEVRQELLEEYVAAGPTDHLREWRMNLAHRHRFAVGACAWRYSLFAWPVMPALDRALIELAQRLPFAVVKDRQVQTRLLISRFPQLARLDLDRNYLDTIPLVGTRHSLGFDLRRRATKLRRRVQVWAGRDPRFYVRTMEFNSPGWRVVRSLADQARGAAAALFRPQALAELLPPAHVTLRRIEDPIIHSAPLKNTLGLMLWLRQHA